MAGRRTNTIIIDKAENIRNTVYEKVFEVYDVFKNHFGEEFTDLQDVLDIEGFKHLLVTNGAQHDESTDMWQIEQNVLDGLSLERPFVLVYWPAVTVTNEHNKSIEIYDLYAKVQINIDGTIPYENRGFLLNRATYPMDQFASNYMHSHICQIPIDNPTEFQPPCLGSGPINRTISTLKSEYNELTWMLFCQELSMYVQVESLRGVPYKYLEQVGTRSNRYYYQFPDFLVMTEENINRVIYSSSSDGPTALINKEDLIKEFAQYYLQHGHLSFSYGSERFTIGMSYYDFMIDISNSFIEFYNSTYPNQPELLNALYSNKILQQVQVAEGRFYLINNQSPSTVGRFDDKFMCLFKGSEIRTKVLSVNDINNNITIILDHHLAMEICRRILNIVNYRYNGNTTNNSRGNQEEEATASTHQRVYYI